MHLNKRQKRCVQRGNSKVESVVMARVVISASAGEQLRRVLDLHTCPTCEGKGVADSGHWGEVHCWICGGYGMVSERIRRAVEVAKRQGFA